MMLPPTTIVSSPEDGTLVTDILRIVHRTIQETPAVTKSFLEGITPSEIEKHRQQLLEDLVKLAANLFMYGLMTTHVYTIKVATIKPDPDKSSAIKN